MKKRTALIAYGALIASIPFSAGLGTALDEYHAPAWIRSFVMTTIIVKGLVVIFGGPVLCENWKNLK